MTVGPIIIIEDDIDDQEIYAEAIRSIGISNELRFFGDGQYALDYLYTTREQPYMILSDINLPMINGFQLKEKIQQDEYLRTKGIPFIFISTNASRISVEQAYALSVQGYFQKPSNMDEIKNMLRKLFDYWKLCRHINNTL